MKSPQQRDCLWQLTKHLYYQRTSRKQEAESRTPSGTLRAPGPWLELEQTGSRGREDSCQETDREATQAV